MSSVPRNHKKKMSVVAKPRNPSAVRVASQSKLVTEILTKWETISIIRCAAWLIATPEVNFWPHYTHVGAYTCMRTQTHICMHAPLYPNPHTKSTHLSHSFPLPVRACGWAPEFFKTSFFIFICMKVWESVTSLPILKKYKIPEKHTKTREHRVCLCIRT